MRPIATAALAILAFPVLCLVWPAVLGIEMSIKWKDNKLFSLGLMATATWIGLLSFALNVFDGG